MISTVATARTSTNGRLIEDGTTNPRDAGLQITLPVCRALGSSYFFRVRSRGAEIDNPAAGMTSGSYKKIRTREAEEVCWVCRSVRGYSVRDERRGTSWPTKKLTTFGRVW